jgi:hypothetical protein
MWKLWRPNVSCQARDEPSGPPKPNDRHTQPLTLSPTRPHLRCRFPTDLVADSAVLGPAQPLQAQRMAQHVAPQPFAPIRITPLDGHARMHACSTIPVVREEPPRRDGRAGPVLGPGRLHFQTFARGSVRGCQLPCSSYQRGCARRRCHFSQTPLPNRRGFERASGIVDGYGLAVITARGIGERQGPGPSPTDLHSPSR